ncbi:unnamed protein product, partial [Choristocarpus tenellus]
MDIFVLGGQSNMAGRGSGHLPPHYSGIDEDVLCFSGNERWTPAQEPLHSDIDLRKRERCGFGPALVCARALLTLRAAAGAPTRSTIGLVPCAIGGASLDEWQADYQGKSLHNHPQGSDSKTNGPWNYKAGTYNLFNAMTERAMQALKLAPKGSHLRGVLWYQGETDAMHQYSAETYSERFERLVLSTRQHLSIPNLRFFTVAITGTTTRLVHLEKVREAQESVMSTTGLDNVWVADAFGLPMFPDGLHLTTSGQVELGERLARQVFAS